MTSQYEQAYKKVWLGFGGNIGDVPHNMALALKKLVDSGDNKLLDVASLYKTPPWGKIDQPWFYNSCAVLLTKLDPHGFLDLCLKVELDLKRERVERWGPRTIDLDVLSFEGIDDFQSDRLTVPHPRMHERCFVLLPLAEIAPDLIVDGNKIIDLAQKCFDEKIEKLSIGKQWITL